jgi:hypothetical protein
MKLPEEIRRQLSILPEDPERYFEIAPDTRLVPLSSLEPTRARPEGILNANRLMRAAYDATHPKRAPLSVDPLGDGRYRILDGNSTYANALHSGWKSMPVALVDSDDTTSR